MEEAISILKHQYEEYERNGEHTSHYAREIKEALFLLSGGGPTPPNGKNLTKKYTDGSFGVADDLVIGENSHDFKEQVINRLGQYEHNSYHTYAFTTQPVDRCVDCPMMRKDLVMAVDPKEYEEWKVKTNEEPPPTPRLVELWSCNLSEGRKIMESDQGLTPNEDIKPDWCLLKEIT